MAVAVAALRVSFHRVAISSSYRSSASSLVSAKISQFREIQRAPRHPCLSSTLFLRSSRSVAVWSKSNSKEHHLRRVTAQVGRRNFAWRTTELGGVQRVSNPRLLQKSGHMSSSETPRCFSDAVEADLTLVKKKCTPCSSKDLQPMTVESAKSLLEQIPGWDLLEIDGNLQLQKSWKAKNFVKGLEFIKTIADVAESEGHHPDLHLVNWNDVTANIWTHAIGGLTENDFILAAKINTLSGEGYLRKKPAPKPTTVAI